MNQKRFAKRFKIYKMQSMGDYLRATKLDKKIAPYFAQGHYCRVKLSK